MITQEKLNEIIENHGKWLRNEEGGCRANLSYSDLSGSDLSCSNLSGSDLSYSDLSGSDLSYSNLSGSDLSYSTLSYSNLRGSDLTDTDLTDTDLTDADLRGACLTGTCLTGTDLTGTYLRGADLDKKYYQVVRIGSRKGTTTYNATDDIVLCGCWNKYKGGTLDAFAERVESVYGAKGSNPNKQYYDEYTAAIEFFLAMKKLPETKEE